MKKYAMVRVFRLIDEQRRRLTRVIDDNVHIAIVVNVAKGGSAAGVQRSVVELAGIGDLLKCAISHVMEQLKLLAITDLVRDFLHLGRDITVGDENIKPA